LQPLPAWSSNLGKRLVKAPKVILSDTGLSASLLALNKNRLIADRVLAGPLLENFVVDGIAQTGGMEPDSAAAFSLSHPNRTGGGYRP
jgi:predicted AAA+ superfamily ATPase